MIVRKIFAVDVDEAKFGLWLGDFFTVESLVFTMKLAKDYSIGCASGNFHVPSRISFFGR